MKRKLSPYEKTHLQRFGKGQIDINNYAEMPVEQITGKVEFRNFIFEITADVLIPRIESEELVSLAVNKIKNLKKEKIVIADVGCGSGAIGVSIFLELQKIKPNLELYLSDVSPLALAVAKKNVSRLINDTKPIKLLKSNLLSNYPQKIKFDLITANLPYIPTPRIEVLDKSVTSYEPHLALDGGEDGLQLIKKLIQQVKEKLTPNGLVLLEVDYTHDKKFLQNNLGLTGLSIKINRDQFQRTRFVTISKN